MLSAKEENLAEVVPAGTGGIRALGCVASSTGVCVEFSRKIVGEKGGHEKLETETILFFYCSKVNSLCILP